MRIERKKWVVYHYPNKPDQTIMVDISIRHQDVEWVPGASGFHMLQQSTVFDGGKHGEVGPMEKLETWIHPGIRKHIRRLKKMAVMA